MANFPIDPELHVGESPETVLRQSDDALTYLQRKARTDPDGPWRDALRNFQAIRDEWSALEAVVRLECLLESKDLLIEAKRSWLPSQVDAVDFNVAEPEWRSGESKGPI